MSKPQIPVIHTPMLQGLSGADRDLMLAMMAALGSAASTLMKVNHVLGEYIGNEGGHLDPDDVGSAVDAEVNAIIDLCKQAKERLKPGQVLMVN